MYIIARLTATGVAVSSSFLQVVLRQIGNLIPPKKILS